MCQNSNELNYRKTAAFQRPRSPREARPVKSPTAAGDFTNPGSEIRTGTSEAVLRDDGARAARGGHPRIHP